MNRPIWFSIFLGIAIAIVAISAWMRWFAQRAIKQHREQVEKILREMREEIDKSRSEPDDD